MIPSDNLASRQWYLFESLYDAKPDIGLGLPEIWDDYTGRGVTIGIWDDGIEYTHPDLDGSYDTSLHVTLDGEIHDPTANSADSDHGTAVAGLIAADSNDGGTVGVAHGARIAGVDFNSSVGTTAITFGALRNFDVVNHSWSPDVGYTFDRNDSDWTLRYRDGLEDSVDNGRDGLGTITVFSAGNRRAIDRHTNDSGLTSAAEAIAVGAVGKTGIVSPYSTPGSTLLISAPSSGLGAIWTTDRTGNQGYNTGSNQSWNPSLDHTATFGGTSTAAALTTGVVALMLEANPGLGWRDVQEILAYSARHVGGEIGGDRLGAETFDWAFNGATTWNGGGLHHSNDYGFGLIDTFAAIRLAERWTETQTSANRRVETDATWSGAEQVRDGDSDAISIGFTVTEASDVETVAVDLDFDGGRIADYRIVLVSPDGTRSVLSTPGRDGEGNDVTDWFFASKAFMGEDATGNWRLLVTDPTANGREGTLRGAELIFLGGQATTDDVFVFTDEFSDYAGAGFGHSGQITDSDGGTDILNASAMRDQVTIDFSTGKGTIDGVDITLNGRFEGALGGDGDDALSGGTFGELFDGGRGDDRLVGHGGNDVLDGGPGNDTMTGGAGDDIFVKRPGESDDTITDFEKGLSVSDGDKVDISSYSIGLTAIVFETEADGLRIRLWSDSILLQGSSLTALGATDFIGLAAGNTPPEIASADSFDFVEGATGPVFTATATDDDVGDTVTFSLGGADADAFMIDGSEVSFVGSTSFSGIGGEQDFEFDLIADDGTDQVSQSVTVTVQQDSDKDLVSDIADNAILVANADQRDSNGDGYGNVIDADLTGDRVVDVADLLVFRGAFGATGLVDGTDPRADADFNGGGVVDVQDLLIFRGLFGRPLEASGVDYLIA